MVIWTLLLRNAGGFSSIRVLLQGAKLNVFRQIDMGKYE